MEKVQIKSSSVGVYGQKVNLPIDGDTKVSEDGILEVSKECAKLLVDNTEHYSYVELAVKQGDKKPVKAKADSKAKTKEQAEKVEENEQEESEEADDEEADEVMTKESLDELDLADLIEILKDAEIDEAKYSKFVAKKSLLINFILKTIK